MKVKSLTTFRSVMGEGPLKQKMTFEVTAAEPGRRLARRKKLVFHKKGDEER